MTIKLSEEVEVAGREEVIPYKDMEEGQVFIVDIDDLDKNKYYLWFMKTSIEEGRKALRLKTGGMCFVNNDTLCIPIALEITAVKREQG